MRLIQVNFSLIVQYYSIRILRLFFSYVTLSNIRANKIHFAFDRASKATTTTCP